MKKLALAAMALTVPLALLAADAPSSPPAQPKIAASINGETITVDELDRLYNQLPAKMKEGYDKAGGKRAFLDTYIRKRLILQEAAKSNFAARPDVAEAVRNARDSVVFDHYIRDVVASSVVTEKDIQAYYNANSSSLTRPASVHVRHILATPNDSAVDNTTGDNAIGDEQAKAKIEKMAALLKNGASFPDLAMKFSEDTTAKSAGDLGWIQQGQTVPEFEAAAFALKKGETSGIVKTEFGYHIIYCDDRREAGVAPLAEVHDQIREKLLADHAADILAQVSTLAQQLRQQSQISVYPENF